jgi:intein-encoded DNA endonuclease-like protein
MKLAHIGEALIHTERGKGNTEGRQVVMDSAILAYIAGFLDGDGSIFFQLVKRKDYIYGYQIRCSIAFYQKSQHQYILEWLKSILGCGYIRHRKTGISDYTIVEPGEVRKILQMLKPYVRLKSEHVKLGIKILDLLNQVTGADDFLDVCRMVDCFKNLNYSKKRRMTSEDVKKFLEQRSYLVPVETDPIRGESHP